MRRFVVIVDADRNLRAEEHRAVVVACRPLHQRRQALFDGPVESRSAVDDDVDGLSEVELVR